jgi:hypothetical protein
MTIVTDSLDAALSAFIAEASASAEAYTPEQLQEIVGLAAKVKATLSHHAAKVRADPKEHIAKIGAIAATAAVDHLASDGAGLGVAGFEAEHVQHLATAMHHHVIHYAARAKEALRARQGAAA